MTWRNWLTITAEIAGIISCILALVALGLMVV